MTATSNISSNRLNGVVLGKSESSSAGKRKVGKRTSAKKKSLKARVRSKLAAGLPLTRREIRIAQRIS